MDEALTDTEVTLMVWTTTCVFVALVAFFLIVVV